jgi:carbonic anhydrase
MPRSPKLLRLMDSGIPAINPDKALQRLIEGNARFVHGEPLQQSPGPRQLADLTQGQSPFATILGCSDSRVPPEMVFDQGLGDLFIVRVAGNVVSTEILGSLGYALAHLHTSLFVVLGHEGCGAVQAALKMKFHRQAEPGTVGELLEVILPGLEGINPSTPAETQWQHAVEANVRWSVRQLAAAPGARALLAEGRVRVVGAIYELATGCVRFLREEEPTSMPDRQSPTFT